MRFEQSQENFEAIAQEINQMAEADQDMRRRAEENNGVIETEEDNQIDIKNTARMKEVIDTIGWPSISMVGKEAAHKAWLLVQHADHDVEFQKKCLDLIKNLPEGEINPQDLAYLEDRVRVNESRSQVYGTQFFKDPETGLHKPRPIEDLENLEKRRADMGLVTMEEDLKFWDDLNNKIKK